MALLLGYDVGSSSIKATLMEADTGKVLAAATSPEKELEIIAEKLGWAEQQPAVWWDNVKSATQKVKAQAEFEAAGLKDKEKLGSLAGFIERVKANVRFIRERLQFLQSGAGAAPEDLPRAFRHLSGGKGIQHFFGIMGRVAILFIVALFIDWLFNRYIARARRHIASSPPDKWRGKMGRLALNALIDFVSICVFTMSILIVILILSEERRLGSHSARAGKATSNAIAIKSHPR